MEEGKWVRKGKGEGCPGFVFEIYGHMSLNIGLESLQSCCT